MIHQVQFLEAGKLFHVDENKTAFLAMRIALINQVWLHA